MSRSLSIRVIFGVALAGCALATCAVGLAVWQNRSDAIADAVRTDENSAIFLAGQIEEVILAVDNILKDYRNQVEKHDAQSNNKLGSHLFAESLYSLRDSMVATRSRVPYANHLSVVDSQGSVRVTTSASPALSNMGDRDYFRDLQANDDDRLSISLPVLSRFNNEPVIVFARRINGHDRTFRGVVFLSISTTYLERTYRAAGLLQNQTFALMRRNGAILFRYPFDQTQIGQEVPPRDRWHMKVSEGGGSFRSFGLFDGIVRWVSVRPVTGYPIVVTITVPEVNILENWRSRSIYTAVGASGFLICLVVLLVILYRQFKKLNASQLQFADQSASLSVANTQLAVLNARLVDINAELRDTNTQFTAALGHMIQGLCMFDSSGRLRVCNDQFRRIYGLAPDFNLLGMNCDDVEGLRAIRKTQATKGPDMFKELSAALCEGGASDKLIQLDDGRTISVRFEPMAAGGWLETHEDVTDRRNYEAKIELLAKCDPLTGLLNRTSFIERLQSAQTSLRSNKQAIAVLMIDLDRFKDVNDTLGHCAGDTLLKEIAERLKSAIRTEDTLARLGGDEFAIVQSPSREREVDETSQACVREDAAILANRIVEVIGEPYNIAGQKTSIGASIGIALTAGDGDDAIDLMKKADLALYQAKACGRNTYRFFELAMTAEVEARHRLENDLRHAIENKEFVLHYQPIVALGSENVCGVEALLRWNHPERGLVPPDRFITLAKQTGLIVPLGEWVLQAACAEAVSWPASVKLAVNISAVQFRKTNLLDVIMRALVDSGLPPDRLEVEITETVLLANEKQNLSILHTLRNLGISISLDDFGTGYSSLSYLAMFPFDKLKIDQSFTRGVLTRSDCAAIVCSAAALGRSLGMTVLAEGVEAREQVQVLRMTGVSQAQGYLFGRPAPASEIVRAFTTEAVVAVAVA